MGLKEIWSPIHRIVDQLKKRSHRTPPTIKIDTTNGRHWEFHAPILVKEVLADHPGDAVFATHNRSRALKDSEILQPGNSYFLSHPRRRGHNSGDGSGSHGLRRSKSHTHDEGSRHVWFASKASYIESGGGEGEESVGEAKNAVGGGEEEKVTRVKVVLSRDEYEELLRHGEEGLLNSLLEQLKLQRSLSAPHLSPAPSLSS